MGDHYETRDEAVEALHKEVARLGFDGRRVDLAGLEGDVLSENRRRTQKTAGWTFDPTRGEALRRKIERYRR